MSIQFFITPYEPSEWEMSSIDLKIDLIEMKRNFLERWPNAEFSSTPKGGLTWNIREENSAGFFGSVQHNLQIVSFNPGNWRTILDFIIWYREFVPPIYKLFLFNSTSSNSLELTPNTTRETVSRFVFGS